MSANSNVNNTSSTGGVVDHVKTFLSGSNKADSTEVCTETAPAVVQEHVSRNETVEQIEAIDRERHIHHHQHRVQPIVDQQTLPTQHQYNVVPEVTRESKHDMLPEHREKLEQQRTLYRDTKEVGETQRTLATAPAVAAEHVHHHVHETIQPVINRETVQNTHVHTTIPIHEKIHDAPIVHEHTVLPTVSLKEFETKVGGVHQHKDASHEHAYYEGSPRVGADGKASNLTSTHGDHHHSHGTGLTGNNTTGTGLTGNNHTGTGLTGNHNNTTGTGLTGGVTGNHNNTAGDHHHSTAGETAKSGGIAATIKKIL